MKHRLLAMLFVLLFSARSWGFLEVSRVSQTLGRIVAQSNNIVVLQVESVNREQRVIVYDKVADLKSDDPQAIARHRLDEGTNPRSMRTILDWAEPGELAVCFKTGNGCLICIGGYWYQCAASQGEWWIMSVGRPELSYAYCGSVRRLREAIPEIVAGREVVVPALKYEVLAQSAGGGKWTERRLEHWATYEAVASGRLMRGTEWPIWRIKVSLQMPPTTYLFVQQSLTGELSGIVGPGPAGPQDMPHLIDALNSEEAAARMEAAEELALMGPAALPRLRR